jgi:hypothetical protein
MDTPGSGPGFLLADLPNPAAAGRSVRYTLRQERGNQIAGF